MRTFRVTCIRQTVLISKVFVCKLILKVFHALHIHFMSDLVSTQAFNFESLKDFFFLFFKFKYNQVSLSKKLAFRTNLAITPIIILIMHDIIQSSKASSFAYNAFKIKFIDS